MQTARSNRWSIGWASGTRWRARCGWCRITCVMSHRWMECCDRMESLEVISDNSNRTDSSTRLRKSSSMTSILQSLPNRPPSDRLWSFSSIHVRPAERSTSTSEESTWLSVPCRGSLCNLHHQHVLLRLALVQVMVVQQTNIEWEQHRLEGLAALAVRDAVREGARDRLHVNRNSTPSCCTPRIWQMDYFHSVQHHLRVMDCHRHHQHSSCSTPRHWIPIE